MLFSSITFLYYFLPLVLILYYAVPNKLKNTVLLIFSLVFYGWGEPKLLLLMALTILIGYISAVVMSKTDRKGLKKTVFIVSITVIFAFLAYFKYASFFVRNFAAITGISAPVLNIALPIGISFYTFQIISYVIDVYWGREKCENNLIDFAAYVTMFPQLIAGPIVRYSDISLQMKERKFSSENLYLGFRRFVYGLAKKVLIANAFGALCSDFRGADAKSVAFYWVYAIAFTLQIYFDFSAYSDMAIGLGKILGFDFIENFNYPYISKSITEFWRRWHMSLSSWFRDYVYIPLGGNRVSVARHIFNIAVVWMLTGFWHGAEWNFVIWGIYFAIFLLLEKYVFKNVMEKIPSVIRHIAVMTVIVISFVIFNANGLSGAVSDISAMFGLSGFPLWSSETAYFIRSYAVMLAVGVVGCLPVVKNFFVKAERFTVIRALEPIVLVVLLLVSTAYLVDGSYNPFLYFRF